MMRLFAQSAQPEEPPEEEPSKMFLENIDFRIKSARGMLRTLLKGRSVDASEEMEALPISRRAEIIRRRRRTLSSQASMEVEDSQSSDEETFDRAEAADEEEDSDPQEPESRPARIQSMSEVAKNR